ncbi:MAG: methyltransferase family protein [Promethearchaeota archaeon]
MKLKGMDKLYEKLPAYPGRRFAIIPLKAILAGVLAYLFLIFLDVLPRLFSSIEILEMIEPFLPFLGSILVAAIAMTLIGQVWSARERMKGEHGDLAYQKMFPRGLIGVALIPPIIFHQFTSIRSLPPVEPVNPLTIQWSQSLLPYLGVPSDAEVLVRISISCVIFLLGMLTMRSAILTFGMDYMAVVYLYFPEESEIQEHEIYSVVRHPAYFGGLLMGFGGLIFRLSVYSILMFLIVYGVFRLQARREEKELEERFGDSYREYMKRVPRLCPSPRNLKQWFRFLKP